ncbi:hypothetical protein E5S67_06163 [Microcoleus sp. IPMA8]|uniref:Uncharacterized protein n=1 Tax=Microcoleus asticus IPMA8 TaxID=2563858 RepID=A0ABX2D731_9CYAN|nr:hypothetical protein [Microcoleus asticus]NQE38378.1 hypothetical protein [Microcoleus asticus IPMA8]
MPAFKAIQLLNSQEVTCAELRNCIDSLNRECGHIEAMVSIGFRDKVSGQHSLDYLQLLITRLYNKLDDICTN